MPTGFITVALPTLRNRKLKNFENMVAKLKEFTRHV